MIGYYVHHQGKGHLHRALSVARELDLDVTGLSTLPRPEAWRGDWVQLERDDTATAPTDIDANGLLHWVPERDPSISRRAAQLSRWFDESRPAAMVSDVSVEAAVLARLHGIPVVSVALPGIRTDAAHDLGFGISRFIVAAWPEAARTMLVAPSAADRISPVGAISRFPVVDDPAPAGKRVLVLGGAGGSGDQPFPIELAREQTPGWHWDVLDRTSWIDDPWELIRGAAVIVTHAGQNAIAEVSAARRPAIVLPQQRPFDEQLTTATVLAAGNWPAIVRHVTPATGWLDLVESAAALDGMAWSSWNDGRGAERAARIIERAAR